MTRQDYLKAARLLADILDRSIPIPGTDLRLGLDPLIGLIPGIGDAIAGLAGSMILFLAAQMQVPKIVLVRMSLNVALNGVLGSIPLVGDAFSFWFKSNVRNFELLERHGGERRASTVGDWIFVGGLFVTIFAVFIAAMIGVVWIVQTIRHGA